MVEESARDLLIRAGEQLYAERGVGRVRLRELNTAAGVKNDSAVHYHFGSQGGLLEEILRLHLAEVGARVAACTARLCAGREGSPEALRDAIAALAIPFVEKLGDERGRRFIRIMAQVGAGERWPQGHFVPDSALAMDLIRRSVPDLDPGSREERIGLITPFVIAAIAAEARREDVNAERVDALVFDVVSMAAAAYFAPAPVGDFWPDRWPRVEMGGPVSR